MTGQQMDADILIELVVEGSPPGIRRHLELNASLYVGSYEKLRDMVTSWIDATKRLSASEDTSQPMEVDVTDHDETRVSRIVGQRWTQKRS